MLGSLVHFGYKHKEKMSEGGLLESEGQWASWSGILRSDPSRQGAVSHHVLHDRTGAKGDFSLRKAQDLTRANEPTRRNYSHGKGGMISMRQYG